ncbi:MAG: hypothetical protein QM503_15320 [Bacteroidota bacterium]
MDTHYDKMVSVLGLLIKCPFDNPLYDCPALTYRHLSVAKKLRLAKSMSEEDLDNIISHHEKCIKAREQEELGGL